MFLQILFWYFIVALVLKVYYCLQDHPRDEKPTTVEVDFMSLFVMTAITIFMYIEIWKK